MEFKPQSENFILYDGNEIIPWQRTNTGTVLFYAQNIPAKGYKSFTLRQDTHSPQFGENMIQGNRLENDYFVIELDEHANIASWFDKRQQRELVAKDQPMNRLIALEDMPPADDAWNINAYINEKTWALDEADSIRIVENGPVRGIVEIQRTFRKSVITQQIVIYHDIGTLGCT